MNATQSNEILQSMINFIKSHGEEKVTEIKEQAAHDFSVAKEKMIESEKIFLDKKFKTELDNAEVKLKIERSAEMNKARIEKMRETAKLVDGLQEAAKVKLHQTLTDAPKKYEALLKELLVQGLIKMIEPTVTLKVRKSDLALIKSII
jgi:V-type H+-transporting ATPase subunit E